MNCRAFAFCIVLFFLSSGAFAWNRFFKVDFGLKIAGMAVDIADKNPRNYAAMRFDFALGLASDLWFAPRVALGIDFLYQRKGAVIGGETLVLHYLSVPMLFKFFPTAEMDMSLLFGLVHSFLVDVNGRLVDPDVRLSRDDVNVYDFGFSFGMQYLFYQFQNGEKFFGEIRMEFDWINVYRYYSPRLWNRVFCFFALGVYLL